VAAAKFSSNVIKRMAETGDLIDFSEPETGDLINSIIESGAQTFEKRVRTRAMLYLFCFACGSEFTQWRSLIRRGKYHCKGFETGKNEICSGCRKWPFLY